MLSNSNKILAVGNGMPFESYCMYMAMCWQNLNVAGHTVDSACLTVGDFSLTYTVSTTAHQAIFNTQPPAASEAIRPTNSMLLYKPSYFDRNSSSSSDGNVYSVYRIINTCPPTATLLVREIVEQTNRKKSIQLCKLSDDQIFHLFAWLTHQLGKDVAGVIYDLITCQ